MVKVRKTVQMRTFEPAAGQSASGRASKQEAGRAAGEQIKQGGGLCSLVLVRCIIFFILFRRFGRSDSLLGYPHPRTPPLPPGARAPGFGCPYPRQKIFIKNRQFRKVWYCRTRLILIHVFLPFTLLA